MVATLVAALAFNGMLLLVSLGVGRVCLRVLRFPPLRRLDSLLFSVALGYAAIVYVLLALGLGGVLEQWTAWAVIAGAAAISMVQLPSLPQALRPIAAWSGGIRITPWIAVLLAIVAVHATLNLIGALAPPSMADPLRQHLAAPKYYADVGAFPFVPIAFWDVPGQLHVTYTLELLVANDIAPAVTHYLFSLLTAFAIFALGRRYVGATAGVIGAAIFYVLPMTTELSTSPMVELGAAFYAVLLVYALMMAGRSLDLRWVALAGLFGGLAAATKLWALTAGPAGIVAILAIQGALVLRQPRRVFLAVTLYGAAFGLVLSPWLIRNFLASGDPLWPLGFQLFHGRYWTEWQVDKFANWTAGPGNSVWLFFLGPWNLTNHIVSFVRPQGALSSALLSPLLLVFVPAVWIFRTERKPGAAMLIGTLAAFCIVVYAIWFSGYQKPRYIQVLHPLISLLAGVGVTAVLAARQRWVTAAASGALALSFVVTLGVAIAFNSGFLSVVFGMQSREAFLADNVPHYASIAWGNEHLPTEAKVLFVGLSGWYYLEREWWPGLSVYQGLIPYHEMRTPEEFLSKIEELKITHVLIQGDSVTGRATVEERLEDILGDSPKPDSYLSQIQDFPESVGQFEERPILLLGAMEENGSLRLLHVGRDKVVESRTFGGTREVEFAVYEVRLPRTAAAE